MLCQGNLVVRPAHHTSRGIQLWQAKLIHQPDTRKIRATRSSLSKKKKSDGKIEEEGSVRL